MPIRTPGACCHHPLKSRMSMVVESVVLNSSTSHGVNSKVICNPSKRSNIRSARKSVQIQVIVAVELLDDLHDLLSFKNIIDHSMRAKWLVLPKDFEAAKILKPDFGCVFRSLGQAKLPHLTEAGGALQIGSHHANLSHDCPTPRVAEDSILSGSHPICADLIHYF